MAYDSQYEEFVSEAEKLGITTEKTLVVHSLGAGLLLILGIHYCYTRGMLLQTSVFLLILPAVIWYILKRGNKSAVSVSSIAKKLNIPPHTQGFMSGQSIYARSCVFVSDELIFVPDGHPSKAVHITYEDISDIRLRGWLPLHFRIRTKTDIKEVRISPIIQFDTAEYGTAIVSDTVTNYMRYMAPYRSFINILSRRSVPSDVLAHIGWGWATLRRIISYTIITVISLAIILALIIVSSNY